MSDGALGSVLFAMSCGVLLSFPLAGKGAQLLGARQLALLAGVALLLMLPMPFLIGILPSLVLVMLEVGAALGTMQVAMNVLAVDVQARVPRPIMSSLHGAWSAGGLVGAGVGSLAAHAGLRAVAAPGRRRRGARGRAAAGAGCCSCARACRRASAHARRCGRR